MEGRILLFPSPGGVCLVFLAQIPSGLNNFIGQDFWWEGEVLVAESPVA